MARLALPQVPDPLLNRVFGLLQQAVNDLDSRIPNGVLTEAVAYALGDFQITSQPVVVARIAGLKIQLPRANNLGTSVAEILVVINQSSGSVSVLAQGSDKVNGASSITLTTGQGAICVTDGDGSIKAWVA